MTTRNAIIIIILCIVLGVIATGPSKKVTPLGLNVPAPEYIKDAFPAGPSRRQAPRPILTGGRGAGLRDAVAGNRIRRLPAHLTPANDRSQDFRDAVADHAAGTSDDANTPSDAGEPPRGSGQGGFEAPPYNPRPIISPSGPTPQSEPLPQH